MNNKEMENLNLKQFEKKEKKDYFDFFARTFSTNYAIDVRVDSVSELYSKYDPSPLPRRYLNDDVEAYILGQIQHAAHNAKITLNFYLVDPKENEDAQIAESCINHFKDRAFEQYMLNKRRVRIWIGSLFFGLLFLSICLAIAHFLRQTSDVPLFAILSEGFGIIGWVALWEPASYLLYGKRQDNLTLWNYMRLCHAKINITV